MLQLMLHSHPRIAIAPETRFTLLAYRQRLDFGDLETPSSRRGLAESIVASPAFEKLGLDRQLIAEQIVAGPATVGSAGSSCERTPTGSSRGGAKSDRATTGTSKW